MTDVIAEIAALTGQIAATSHVGRSNRLLRRLERLFDAIDARVDRLDLLRRERAAAERQQGRLSRSRPDDPWQRVPGSPKDQSLNKKLRSQFDQ